MNTNTTLSLIIKPTRKCNLRCSYCHDWRSRGPKISFEVLANLTAKALAPNKYRLVNFIWHGGEPLLLGIDFFKKALSLQEAFINDNQYVMNSIQTNGTLLNEEWCEFFRRNRFNVGVSIDGPEEIHNLNRSYMTGKGSFQDIVKKLDLLRSFNISFGILLVLNENSLRLSPPEIFEFMINDLKVKSFSFLPAVPSNIPGHEVAGDSSGGDTQANYFTLDSYSDFMIEIFDYWYSLDDPEIKIRELEGITRSILRGNPQLCTLAGDCIGSNYHIEAEGDVYHCDRFLGDENYHLGNVLTDTFESILESDKFLGLLEDERAGLDELSSCEYFDICNGGCPHDRYIAAKYVPGYAGECCGQGKLIAHIKESLATGIGERNMGLLGHSELPPPVRMPVTKGW